MLKASGVEIKQEGNPQSGQFQVGQRLGLVKRHYILHRLELDQNSFVDDQIRSVGTLDH